MCIRDRSGHREILQPLAGFRGVQAAATSELAFQRVTSVADLNTRVQAANGRPVMLDFWAEWCVSCKEMDQFTFSDPRVQNVLKDAVLLRADVTANNADDRALLARFARSGGGNASGSVVLIALRMVSTDMAVISAAWVRVSRRSVMTAPP